MNEAINNNGQAQWQAAGSADRREQLSALADGQLQGAQFADALAYAGQEEGLATWQLYHLVGDVLRSAELAHPPSAAFMGRLRAELAKEPVPVRPEDSARVAVLAAAPATAANVSVFRWKVAAGLASLVAAAAVGWTALPGVPGDSRASGGAQWAQSVERATDAAPSAPVIAVADAEGQQVMIRDPRLDELLAAHKQFGSTSALQMPAGFLRNATFEAPQR